MSVECSLPSKDANAEHKGKHWSKKWVVNGKDICARKDTSSRYGSEYRNLEDDETAHVTCKRQDDSKVLHRFCAHIETMNEAHKVSNWLTDYYVPNSKMDDASVSRFRTYYNERRKTNPSQEEVLNFPNLVQNMKDKARTNPTSVMLFLIAFDKEHNHDDLLPTIQNLYNEMFHYFNGLRNPSVDFTSRANLAIRWASEKGLYEIINLLLTWVGANNERVDPKTFNEEAVRWASKNGHDQVVELLLAWVGANGERVDPTAGNNYAIQWASKNGHDKVVDLLLKWKDRDNKRVDPTAGNEFAIQWASENGHDKVVKLLLDWKGFDNKRVDPTVDQEEALMMASQNGHDKVVELLLDWVSPDGKRVNAMAQFGEAIQEASKNGHDKVVKLLLDWSTKVANISIEYQHGLDFALFLASESGHDKVVQLLLEYRGPNGERVNPKHKRSYYTKRDAMESASENGHNKVVDLLLEHRGPNVNSDNLTSLPSRDFLWSEKDENNILANHTDQLANETSGTADDSVAPTTPKQESQQVTVWVYHTRTFRETEADLYQIFTTKKKSKSQSLLYGDELDNISNDEWNEIFQTIYEGVRGNSLCTAPKNTRWFTKEEDCEHDSGSQTTVNPAYLYDQSLPASTRTSPNPKPFVTGSFRDAHFLLVAKLNREIVGFATLQALRTPTKDKKRARLPDVMYMDVLCGSERARGLGELFLKFAETLARFFDMKYMKLRALQYMMGTKQECKHIVRQRNLKGNKDKYEYALNQTPIRTLVGYYRQKHNFQVIPGAFNPNTRGIQMVRHIDKM